MKIFVDTGAWIAIADKNDQYAKTAGQSTSVFGNTLKTIDFLTIEPVTPLDWEKGWIIFGEYLDKNFSFTDCTSFALMERMEITKAFAFDKHFRQYGKFTVLP